MSRFRLDAGLIVYGSTDPAAEGDRVAAEFHDGRIVRRAGGASRLLLWS